MKIFTSLLLIVLGFCLSPRVQGQSFFMTNGSATTCGGTFYDSGGSLSNYANNEYYVYTICPLAGSCIQLNFTSFNIESGYDYMYIYDGPSTSSSLIGVYTGTSSPGTVTATNGCLTIEFSSDFIVSAPGWAATISCVPCTGGGGGGNCLPNMTNNCTDSTCSGNFYDSGGTAGNYAPNSNLVHTICASSNCLQINWNSFELESGFDFINIYDGPSTFSTSLGSYTGYSLPPTIVSSSGCLTFQFFSDGIFNYSGWEASLSCVPCGSGPTATTADCDSAIQVCSATTSFPITANGIGSFNEIPLSGSYGNPDPNPFSSNSGCLLDEEINSTWLIFQIQTSGLLEFVFGGSLYPQTGFTDWMMYELTNSSCSAIPANTLAPSGCNWNCSSLGGTGMLSPANIPATSSACNYEPPLTVTAGQRFVICFTNWSNVNGNVAFEFMNNPGDAIVDCTPILHYNDIHLNATPLDGKVSLDWTLMNPEFATAFEVQRLDENGWQTLGSLAPKAGEFTYQWEDASVVPGQYEYRIRMVAFDGNEVISNVETVTLAGDIIAKIYPNPARETVSVTFSDLEWAGKLTLQDVIGKVLWEAEIAPVNGATATEEISLSGLKPGVYFLRAGKQTLRLIKE
ncbi:MAG: T9SS type A sorting domain-containing protein [Bacteroidia bacterium]|nr:T9SS type A sorting domain-containing protein [Bacteroidia bacterium]